MKPLRKRFFEQVDKTDTCWLWTGPLSGGGYGRMFLLDPPPYGRDASVHRVSLELEGIEIPPGMVVDHLCHVRNCVRPDHLEVVTVQVNNQRKSPYRRQPQPPVKGSYKWWTVWWTDRFLAARRGASPSSQEATK